MPGGQAKTLDEFIANLSLFRSGEAKAYAEAFCPRPDDILIATFAKAGTTWMQQIVHGLRTGGDMDFSEITAVVPWIEQAYNLGIDIEAEQKGGFRAFKSHLSWHDVQKGGRYINVIRDPRDSAVSFFNFMDGWFIEKGAISIDEFVTGFFIPPDLAPDMKDGYWAHLLSWWSVRDNPDVLMLAFEDMKADHAGAVRRVAEFLGLDISPQVLEIATAQSTFQFMKENEHHFDDHLIVRARNPALGIPLHIGSTKVATGKVGGHQQQLGDETVALLDDAWAATVGQALGFATYGDLRAELSPVAS